VELHERDSGGKVDAEHGSEGAKRAARGQDRREENLPRTVAPPDRPPSHEWPQPAGAIATRQHGGTYKRKTGHTTHNPKMTICALDGDTGKTCDRVPVTNATRCLPSTT
jgi:hypothetical protein